MLTDNQWEKIYDKYSRLMWTIAHKISGDVATTSFEDNLQDIHIAALDAVIGFKKKTSREFDEFWGEKLFDQYFKTCLWNAKNSKGAAIVKRYVLLKGTVSTSENEEVLNLRENKGENYECRLFFEDLKIKLSLPQKEVVNTLLRCPSYITETGKINVAKLSRSLGIDKRKAKTLIAGLTTVVKNQF